MILKVFEILKFLRLFFFFLVDTVIALALPLALFTVLDDTVEEFINYPYQFIGLLIITYIVFRIIMRLKYRFKKGYNPLRPISHRMGPGGLLFHQLSINFLEALYISLFIFTWISTNFMGMTSNIDLAEVDSTFQRVAEGFLYFMTGYAMLLVVPITGVLLLYKINKLVPNLLLKIPAIIIFFIVYIFAVVLVGYVLAGELTKPLYKYLSDTFGFYFNPGIFTGTIFSAIVLDLFKGHSYEYTEAYTEENLDPTAQMGKDLDVSQNIVEGRKYNFNPKR